MENKIFTPLSHDNCDSNEKNFKLFLAGTIDNGNSLDWQTEIAKEIASYEVDKPIHIYNPRRAKWPEGDDHNEIEKQIKWELYHLEKSDLIIMNILPGSKSPISLMEIGLFAKEKKLVVFCNQSFYRYDNVKIVCKTYDIPLYNTNDILVIRNVALEKAKKQ